MTDPQVLLGVFIFLLFCVILCLVTLYCFIGCIRSRRSRSQEGRGGFVSSGGADGGGGVVFGGGCDGGGDGGDGGGGGGCDGGGDGGD